MHTFKILALSSRTGWRRVASFSRVDVCRLQLQDLREVGGWKIVVIFGINTTRDISNCLKFQQQRLVKLRITILTCHSWYSCQISLQIMLLPKQMGLLRPGSSGIHPNYFTLVFVTKRCKTLAIMIEGHDNFASLRFSTSVTRPKTKKKQKKNCVTRKES